MSLEILGIADRGVPNTERLNFRATIDMTLSHVAIFATSYATPSSITRIPRYTYWFPPKLVKAGDYVILFTGTGRDYDSKNTAGTMNHLFYWGLPQVAFAREPDCAVIVDIRTWRTTPAK